MQRIAVIDYGMGNLRSVSKAVEVASPGAEVVVTSDADLIASAERIVCPGQGAAKDCMLALSAAGLLPVIEQCVQEKPFFGICMGMQVLLAHSDENDGVDCLGVIPGRVERFASPLTDGYGARLKVPHMGWSQVTQCMDHPLWHGVENNSRFYFAHSYFVVPDDPSVVAAHCEYGSTIAVSLAKNSLFATQFHPEKSAQTGLQLLKNFSRWNGAL